MAKVKLNLILKNFEVDFDKKNSIISFHPADVMRFVCSLNRVSCEVPEKNGKKR